MNRIKYTIFFMVCWLVVIFLSTGCNLLPTKNDFNEVFMKDYYLKEDFQSIIMGESTFQDVYTIAPVESMQVTSYGGVCEYPMRDGGCIRIKFYGKDLVVGEIEEFFYETQQHQE